MKGDGKNPYVTRAIAQTAAVLDKVEKGQQAKPQDLTDWLASNPPPSKELFRGHAGFGREARRRGPAGTRKGRLEVVKARGGRSSQGAPGTLLHGHGKRTCILECGDSSPLWGLSTKRR